MITNTTPFIQLIKFVFIVFFIPFLNNLNAQCALNLEGCYLEGERVWLSSAKTMDGYNWFSFEAKSNLLAFEIDNHSSVSVIIGEFHSENCSQSEIEPIQFIEKVIGDYLRVTVNTLNPGKKYAVLITTSSSQNSLYFKHLPVEKLFRAPVRRKSNQRNIVAIKQKGNTQAPHRMASNKFDKSSKSKPVVKVPPTKYEMETRITKLKKRIQVLEADPETKPEYLEKMRSALYTWEKQLQNLK